ncbi:hypothetical protein [Cryobacterium sp. HLT2-28]|uniref:hypothetical protein n=1 Tax=Cryobacterium sp. HLT2-28 TaxID=1259146 RepID=UPI00106A9BCF|nr:hypothetical protein [Cryobacterium sp. HLT2-28]TFB94948.1 hypothetical protein E3O48_07135 [Cryobacterium sp. HLT2-28]
MTITSELDLSTDFETSRETERPAPRLAPQEEGTYVTTRLPRASAVGSYVTTSRAVGSGRDLRGNYVSGTKAASMIAGSYVSL